MYREEVAGHFVFGEGHPGGIMFIGEGPGKVEEEKGRPFMGDTGKFLRDRLKKIGIDRRQYYLTNAVCCRSWSFQYDGSGQVRMSPDGKVPLRSDCEPLPAQRLACRPRLLQQIYVVDPVLIVTLGVAASETVLGKSVAITTENGKLHQTSIPGAHLAPSLTSKGVWMRRDGSFPVVQGKVTYNVMPLIHPAFAIRNWMSQHPKDPLPSFMTGLRIARDIYFKYMQEVYGERMIVPDEDDGTHDWESYDENNENE